MKIENDATHFNDVLFRLKIRIVLSEVQVERNLNLNIADVLGQEFPLQVIWIQSVQLPCLKNYQRRNF